MKVEMTKEWCMNMAKIEARAVELHEGCRMPMEQARELAASEAGPDWYARGQGWGLADALSNCQNGDWTLDDIARAFAAGAQAGAATESKRTLELECRCVALEEQADLTAIHLSRMRSALDQKHAEYEDLQRHGNNTAHNLARMQFALQRLADAADTLGVNHFGSDWRSDEVQELQAATRAARLTLGPNVEVTGLRQQEQR
jgi:hypothetical protein